ncbi:aminotransferase family protein [Acrocarpospora catenulata]|uniref:aminotransferase family protein n=1 Tax=Acrocarpospora catenulata TaxID=2836182 RepID=UPI001BDA9705|nr:aminotransferase class III-fold pyridoxal phosphate-dependent enzyme [Acrocarpospora catenulata]
MTDSSTLAPEFSWVRPVWHHSTLDPEHGARPIVLDRAENIYLWDTDGRRYVDAHASFGSCIVGHGRPEMAQAAYDQLVRGAHLPSVFGCTNEPSARLSQRLLKLTRHEGGSVRYATSGSEAVEAALRIAFNYHLNRGETGRRKILSTLGSYHGTTIATLAAPGEPDNEHFIRDIDSMFVRLPPTPHQDERASEEWVATLRETIERVGPENIAALLAKPIPVSIAGGVRVAHVDHWRKVQEVLRSYGILHITDEVLCGWGRTGKLFGQNHFGIQGDIITVSKGLSSGYFPVSGAIAAPFVTEAFDPNGPRALRHMGTYTAHATGCAVALRAIDIIESEGLVENCARLAPRVAEALRLIGKRHQDSISQVSGIGLFWSVLIRPDGDRQIGREVLAACRERGLILQTWGNTVLFYLPLISTEEQVDEVMDLLAAGFADVLAR